MLHQEAPIRLTFAGVSFDVEQFRRALGHARTAGIRVRRRDGRWFATSGTRPGVVYQVGDRCDCPAGQHGRPCRHVAAVLSARMRAGDLARCDACGFVAPIGQMHYEPRHVGGVGEVDAFYCGAGIGHRAGELVARQAVAA